jgi:hypothetical protein
VDHAQQRSEGQLAADLKPRVELLPRPAVHPDLAAFAALPTADEDRAALSIQVALVQGESFTDPQARAPEQDNQRSEPAAIGSLADRAHDGDDLLDRVGGPAGYCSPLFRGGRPRW